MKALIFLAVLVTIACCQNQTLEGMDNFDTQQFLGHWYEVAHLPQPNEKDIVCTQANYSLNADGTLKAVNAFKNKTSDTNFTITEMVATAGKKPSELNAKYPNTPQPVPYWVAKTDYKTYAVFIMPKLPALWIFARTPTLEENTYKELIDFGKASNYPMEKLVNVTQTCGSFI